MKSRNNAIAAILSLFLPGVGQIYMGKPFLGIFMMFLVGFGYAAFVIPGILLHVMFFIHAAVMKDAFSVSEEPKSSNIDKNDNYIL